MSNDGGGGGGGISGVTHDGGDGKLLLLGVLKETQNVVADDDTGLAVELVEDTHSEVGMEWSKNWKWKWKCTAMRLEGGREKRERVSESRSSNPTSFTGRRKRRVK